MTTSRQHTDSTLPTAPVADAIELAPDAREARRRESAQVIEAARESAGVSLRAWATKLGVAHQGMCVAMQGGKGFAWDWIWRAPAAVRQRVADALLDSLIVPDGVTSSLALALVMARVGELAGEVAFAMADSRLTPKEAAAITKKADAVMEAVRRFKASVRV